MLTPQDVSKRAFSKALMGGYNTVAVDEFLDELTDDYTTLYQENGVIKAKLKVLVDRVEEYRATEDSMRAALLSAQRMATGMVEEAEQKKAQLLAGAEAEARKQIGALQSQLEDEQARLALAQAETAAFVAQLRTVCQQHLSLLDQLPEMPMVAKITPQAESTPDHAPMPQGEIGDDPAGLDFASLSEAEQTAQILDAPTEEADSPFVLSDESEDASFIKRFELDDLQFGRNYKHSK